MAVGTQNNFAKVGVTLKRVFSLFEIMFICCFAIMFGVRVWGAPLTPAQAPNWADQLPEGEGRAIVASDCVLCHTLERVVTAHHSHGEWDKLVGQMIDRGAPLSDDQVPIVVNYLAKSFGPGHVNPATTPPGDSSQSVTPAAGAPKDLNIDPDQAQFSGAPDSLGLPKDIQISMVMGDPSKAGPFSLLLKFPADTIIPPHRESTDESIEVLRGTFEFGEGDDFDAGKLQAVKRETVLRIPADKHNFGRAKGDTILLISGVGPISFGREKRN